MPRKLLFFRAMPEDRHKKAKTGQNPNEAKNSAKLNENRHVATKKSVARAAFREQFVTIPIRSKSQRVAGSTDI
jgi:hypothetical protein